MYGDTVDILLASYNGADYIAAQIQSIQRQDYKNWRLLISDDCSSDDTLNIIKKYSEDDDRIVIVSSGKKFGSACSNFISMLKYAKNKFVFFCDQDDVWLPDKISSFIAKAQENNSDKPLLLYSDLIVTDESLNEISPSYYDYMKIDYAQTDLNQLLAQNVVTGCAMMVNQALIQLVRGRIDPKRIVMHDWMLALVASTCGCIEYVRKPYNLYRQHGDNSVGASKYNIISLLLKDNRRSIEGSISQAKILLDNFHERMTAEQISMLEEYVSIPERNRLCRVLTLFKYKIFKGNLSRLLGQIFFIFIL
ncbi:Glycosyl transferase family 2 [Bifidobacterium magnum]|uniref:Glycosyl transferase family 2 n=2 Tax=Bifidobacterium magnum TaxID=1692 RepID=A0A087BBC3_9BIFI|nr:Glycosyl transferase family 2 [Bifidobacterium magnum]